jgi:hypothetical protein
MWVLFGLFLMFSQLLPLSPFNMTHFGRVRKCCIIQMSYFAQYDTLVSNVEVFQEDGLFSVNNIGRNCVDVDNICKKQIENKTSPNLFMVDGSARLLVS